MKTKPRGYQPLLSLEIRDNEIEEISKKLGSLDAPQVVQNCIKIAHYLMVNEPQRFYELIEEVSK